MSGGGPRGDLDDRAGLAWAAIAGIVIGLVLYPPLVVGGLSGFAAVEMLKGRQRPAGQPRRIRGQLAAGALGLLCLAVIGEMSGVSETGPFLERWRAGGVGHLGLDALTAYPWAWLVPSAALASVIAAVGLWRYP